MDSALKPEKNKIIEVWNSDLKRFIRGKWTGRRWMQFNELFGGYDPIKKVTDWREVQAK